MPIPMNDASQALKTNPEKTEEALQKVLHMPPMNRNQTNKNIVILSFWDLMLRWIRILYWIQRLFGLQRHMHGNQVMQELFIPQNAGSEGWWNAVV